MWRTDGDGTTAAGAEGTVRFLMQLIWLLVAASVLLVLTTGPAFAVPGHKLGGRFSGPGSDPGLLSSPFGLAVQQAGSDVFVVDAGNNRVQRFDAAGAFLSLFDTAAAPDPGATFSRIAGDPSSGHVFVVDSANGAVDRFTAAGAFVSQIDEVDSPSGFIAPIAAAVHPVSGDVYVATGPSSADPPVPAGINVYESDRTFLTQITGAGSPGELSSPQDVGVDADGLVYVLDNGNVHRFTAAGAYDTTIYPGGGAQGIAIDPADDDLFVIESAGSVQVLHYDSSGALLFTFGAGDLGSAQGLGLAGTADRVYVADSSASDVAFFDPFVAPGVTTGPATDIAIDSATLTGTVDPEGIQTSYRFDWGTDPSYGNSTPETDAGSGDGDVPASAPLTGLLPNATYHYWLVATNSDGSNFGQDQSFTTAAAAPTVSTQPATAVRAFSATLNGIVNPNNASTTWFLEYGLTDAYGATTAVGTLDAEMADTPVSDSISGLQPSTTYHYRVVAINDGGTTNGEDQTIMTAPPPPAATVGGATDITATTALLHGTVDTKGLAGSYRFLVQDTRSPYLDATAPVDVAAVEGPRGVSAPISGLPHGTTLKVRVSVTTAGGTATSDAIELSTPALPFAPPPPPPIENPFPYGCAAPHLNPVQGKATRGKVIRLRGSDLGFTGRVIFGSIDAEVERHTGTEIAVRVPSSASGNVSVRVDCFQASNTIRVAIANAKAKPKPKARKCRRGFVKRKVKGQTRCVKRKAARPSRLASGATGRE